MVPSGNALGVDWGVGHFVFALPVCTSRRIDTTVRPNATTPGRTQIWLKDFVMNSSDLFSHPDRPDVAPNREGANEPVQAPAFSDLARNNSTPDTQPSS